MWCDKFSKIKAQERAIQCSHASYEEEQLSLALTTAL